MPYFNVNNRILFHATLVFFILLMTCTSPLMLQAAGGSDDDFTSKKSRNYQQAVSYIKKSDYSAAIFGNIFHVDEVILFKDVDGIYGSDPKKNKQAKSFGSRKPFEF